jgi:hypothetical protein
MKFLPSLKSAKSLALVAATIATAIASSVAPSLADIPTTIITTPGKPDLVVFGGRLKAYKLGCPKLRNVWNRIPNSPYSAQIYEKVITNFGGVAGELYCNTPSRVQGYISPAFGNNIGVVVTDGKPSFIESGEVFAAMGIVPNNLTRAQGETFLGKNQAIYQNPTLTPALANGTPIPMLTPNFSTPPRRLLVLRPDSFASEIIQAPGKPELVIFPNMNQSFTSGCQAVRNLWSRIPTKQVTVQDYEVVQRRNAIGELYCNQPTRVKAYTSPAFSPHAGVIVTNGKPFVVRSGDVFNAMNVDLIRLSDEEGQEFIDRNRSIIDSAVITPNNR